MHFKMKWTILIKRWVMFKVTFKFKTWENNCKIGFPKENQMQFHLPCSTVYFPRLHFCYILITHLEVGKIKPDSLLVIIAEVCCWLFIFHYGDDSISFLLWSHFRLYVYSRMSPPKNLPIAFQWVCLTYINSFPFPS